MVSFIYYCNCNLQRSYQNHQSHILPVLAIGCLQICSHHAGTRSLNDDPGCTLLVKQIITQFGVDFYQAMYIVNRFYYCKFALF